MPLLEAFQAVENMRPKPCRGRAGGGKPFECVLLGATARKRGEDGRKCRFGLAVPREGREIRIEEDAGVPEKYVYLWARIAALLSN